jgi:hypothetical protein
LRHQGAYRKPGVSYSYRPRRRPSAAIIIKRHGILGVIGIAAGYARESEQNRKDKKCRTLKN